MGAMALHAHIEHNKSNNSKRNYWIYYVHYIHEEPLIIVQIKQLDRLKDFRELTWEESSAQLYDEAYHLFVP
jgi:hypothetical protein